MKKLAILFALLLATVFTSAFSVKDWQEDIYHQIRTETIKGLEDAFNADVTIGKTEGLLVGQVLFHDVVVPGFARVPRIYVNYNLATFALKRDIVPAITKITIEDGEFEVRREKDGQISAANLLPAPDPNAPPPPPFRARLVFKNCRVNYKDPIGFRKGAGSFTEDVYGLSGEVSFQKKDRISLKLSGKIAGKPAPAQVRIEGSTNFVTGNYLFNIFANKLDIEKWGNYAVALEPITFSGGKADLKLKLSPPKKPGWPVSLALDLKLDDGRARFNGYEIEKTTGSLALADDSLTFTELTPSINSVPVRINGRIHDLAQQNVDLQLELQDADLNRLVSLFPQTQKMDLQGRGDARLALAGSFTALYASGTATVREGKFYDQEFTGHASLEFQESLLRVNIEEIGIYQGKVTGSADFNFSEAVPRMLVRTRLRQIDLAAAAQYSPGLEGRAAGELTLAGPLNDLRGSLYANLTGALFFGQPIDALASSFSIKDGDIALENLTAASPTASIFSSGTISRDMFFDFKARARGIRLAGSGVVGSMEAMVDSFEGDISWQMNEEFLKAPLKNLRAAGALSLSQGRVGAQEFDVAQGTLSMGQGLVKVQNITFIRRSSVLQAAGQVGVGYPTDLKLSAENFDLEDLRILNYILPHELRNAAGRVDLDLEIKGEISSEAKVVSLDPILDLEARGEVSLHGLKVPELPPLEGTLKIAWKDRLLNISDTRLRTERSSFSLNWGYEGKEDLKANVTGIIDFNEFKKLTEKYGKIEGTLGLNLLLEGDPADPQAAASFWVTDLRFNQLDFDRIEGGLSFINNKLTMEKPVLFVRGGDMIEVAGSADLRGLARNRPEEVELALELKFLRADLSSTIDLYEKLQAEVSRKIALVPSGGKVRVDLSAFRLPDIRKFLEESSIKFYSANGVKNYYLKDYQAIARETQKSLAAEPQSYIGGQLHGRFSVRGKMNSLSGEFEGGVNNGFFRNYAFESLSASASLNTERLRIKNLELTKDRGKLSASGDLNFDGTLELGLTAQDLPLDIMQALFNKDFKGNFNMNAKVDGPIQAPRFSASLTARKVSLADIRFDQIDLTVTKRAQEIFIHELSLREGRNDSNIIGSLNLGDHGGISLEARLKDNALGLLNLFTDDVKWKKGKAYAELFVRGTLDQPSMNGKIDLRDSVLYVRLIDSEIKNIVGLAELKDNLLTVTSLTGIWEGKRTRNHPNFLGMAGTVDLGNALSLAPMIELDLAFTPAQLYADLPDLYTGVIDIRRARLRGPLYFDLSQGPTLSGTIEVNNAVITLSQNKAAQQKVFPLNFDLTLGLLKNTYAVMGDVATLDLSNIFMNLEVKSDDLRLSGNLAYPSLLGRIFLRRGTVTIFNREFSLLTPEQQERYYSLQADKIWENVAAFSGEKGKEGLMPDVRIIAKVDVENIEETPAGELQKQKVIILSRLRGVIGATQKERRLEISFDSFTEDRSKTPAELRPAGYSDQAIKVMLLPDFIKSLTGVSKGEEVDANVVVADYISSRVQTFVFRGIERELEQRFGLESLTLEYNFGKDVRQAMGVQERRVLEGERPDWRVGFVKGFFDKFYLDFNYAQFGSETEKLQETFNYQLTYKLSPIWAIIYYREPISLQELTSGYQKMTLKAGFSFW